MAHGIGLFPVSRADPLAVALAERHYTRSHSHQQVGGRCALLVLRDFVGTILIVWEHPRPEFRRDHVAGINCAIFRNESPALSSTVLLAGERFALARWPGEPFFTYVDPTRVRSCNPGYCFKMAGYHYMRTSSRGYHLLVKPAGVP